MPADDAFAARCAGALLARAVEGGGFAARPAGGYRPDATAWALLALAAGGGSDEVLAAGRRRLAESQLDDGRLPLQADRPGAFWPTPLAILAWTGSPAHEAERERAVAFLLETTGVHWPVDPRASVQHDTSIRGWPWVQETHSWVEPTSLGVLALRAAGRGEHPRVAEALRMLLDRMLPSGGWNYGNTLVFGSELRPLPESTGVALHALAGRVARERVAPSLDYLAVALEGIRTPFTLGWGLLGLGAWGQTPARAGRWLEASLARQGRLGAYDTSHLALLALAHHRPAGLLEAEPGGEHV